MYVQTFHWYCCHRSGHWLTHWKELPRTCHSDFGTGLSCPHVSLGRRKCDSAQRSHIDCGFPAGLSWFLCLHGTTLRWCLSAGLVPKNSILKMHLLLTTKCCLSSAAHLSQCIWALPSPAALWETCCLYWILGSHWPQINQTELLYFQSGLSSW